MWVTAAHGKENTMPVAIITGASRGLGLAMAQALAAQGWSVAADARHGGRLRDAARGGQAGRVVAVPGDVTDAGHRADLVAAARDLGSIALLMNNASRLGPDRKSTRLNSSHPSISYAVFCLKKKKNTQ